MSDIGSRIEGSKNWLERAAEHIPGYRGYKQKELRREADKLQREYVAERLESARRALERLALTLTNQGDLALLAPLDTAGRRLRTVKDKILYADYGCAGLFDTVKVDEDVLDRLYQFDVRSQEEARGIEDLVAAMSAASPSLRSDIDLLDRRITALDQFFADREHLVTGVGR